MAEILKVPDVYKPLYTTEKPIIIVTGGRGSGKSFQSSLFIKRLTYEKNHVILYSRYTMTSAEKSIIPEFTDKMERENDFKYFDITAKEINNKYSGSRIIFSGIKTSSGNQTANLKGIEGLTTFVMDEGEEWQEEQDFDKIRLSIRTLGVKNRSIIIMNPSDINHFIYKKYIENNHKIVNIDGVDVEVSTHPSVCHIHTTYLDNIKFLSPEFLSEVEDIKRNDKEKYANIIIGAWSRNREGAVLDSDTLRYFNPNETREFSGGLGYGDIADEGNDSTCFVFGGVLNEDIYITDVVFNKLLSEVTIPQVIIKAKDNQTKYIRVESNNMGAMYGRQLRDKSNNSFDVLPINSTTNKHTRIIMEVGFIKRKFLFVAPEFQSEEYINFMKEITTYNLDPKKNKHDDGMDALSGLAIFVRQMFYNIT
jgi:phage terminase large subunit